MEDILAASPALSTAFGQLSEDYQRILLSLLSAYDDRKPAERLFSSWIRFVEHEGLTAGQVLERVQHFCKVIKSFDEAYSGGLSSYLSKAKVLLQQSRVQFVQPCSSLQTTFACTVCISLLVF